MELLLMCDAAQGRLGCADHGGHVALAISRSDKKDASRISLGRRLVADVLVTAGADRVLTMALHAPQVHGFFSVPVDHLTAIGVLADHYRGRKSPTPSSSPPTSATPRPRPSSPGCWACRWRPAASGAFSDDKVVIDAIVGDIAGKRAIILDDDRNGRLDLELLERFKDVGCTEASVTCTHGLFAGPAVERLSTHPMITEVVTTDTVPRPEGWPDLQVRSVAGLFAEAISRIHHGRSVSSLFEGVDPTHARRNRGSRSDPRHSGDLDTGGLSYAGRRGLRRRCRACSSSRPSAGRPPMKETPSSECWPPRGRSSSAWPSAGPWSGRSPTAGRWTWVRRSASWSAPLSWACSCAPSPVRTSAVLRPRGDLRPGRAAARLASGGRARVGRR